MVAGLPARLAEMGIDGVIAATGHCGSCTAATMRAYIASEKAGFPAVAILYWQRGYVSNHAEGRPTTRVVRGSEAWRERVGDTGSGERDGPCDVTGASVLQRAVRDVRPPVAVS